MDYFPLFARLTDRPVLVVGGGEVAARKVRLLRDAGARVSVVAPALNRELDELSVAGEIGWHADPFRPDDIADAVLVIAATDDDAVNRGVAEAAEARSRLVNVVDDREHCSFITPSIIDRSPLVIAVSTGGTLPVLARWLRQRIEALLPAGLGRLAAAAGRLRDEVRRRLPDIAARRRFWEQLLDGPGAESVIQAASPELTLSRHLARYRPGRPVGRVSLVGAGPGDPDLLTLRALQVLQEADVVLHDRLVSDAILERIRRDARRIDVGKSAGHHRLDQSEINRKLVELARQGLRVVRLKGGDPFIFGRGGEELEALADAGIDFEVVPGITAAAGCGAYAGIPLTHRDLAHQVVFATAHCKDSLGCLDWPALARPAQTRVFYMPVQNLPDLQARLLEHGLNGSTPAALIENGTREDQRVVRCTLGALAVTAERRQVGSPALLVIGETVRLHDRLAWFQTGPVPATQTVEPASAIGAWAY